MAGAAPGQTVGLAPKGPVLLEIIALYFLTLVPIRIVVDLQRFSGLRKGADIGHRDKGLKTLGIHDTYLGFTSKYVIKNIKNMNSFYLTWLRTLPCIVRTTD